MLIRCVCSAILLWYQPWKYPKLIGKSKFSCPNIIYKYTRIVFVNNVGYTYKYKLQSRFEILYDTYIIKLNCIFPGVFPGDIPKRKIMLDLHLCFHNLNNSCKFKKLTVIKCTDELAEFNVTETTYLIRKWSVKYFVFDRNEISSERYNCQLNLSRWSWFHHRYVCGVNAGKSKNR